MESPKTDYAYPVESTALALERVDHVQGGHGVSAGVLGVAGKEGGERGGGRGTTGLRV